MIISFFIYINNQLIIKMSYDDEVWIEDEKEVCKIERLNEDKSASKFRVDPLAK